MSAAPKLNSPVEAALAAVSCLSPAQWLAVASKANAMVSPGPVDLDQIDLSPKQRRLVKALLSAGLGTPVPLKTLYLAIWYKVPLDYAGLRRQRKSIDRIRARAQKNLDRSPWSLLIESGDDDETMSIGFTGQRTLLSTGMGQKVV